MPVVELDLRHMRKLLQNKASVGKIKETLPFLGLDVESESNGKIRIEYSPNRPDYSTEHGIAIGLEGMLGLKKGGVSLRIKKSRYNIKVDDSVRAARPYITAMCATGGSIDLAQIIGMQEDLHSGIGRRRKKSAIGIHDLDAVSFPLRYTTTDRSHRFTPLYQEKPMTVGQILSDTQTGRDYAHLVRGRVPVILDSKESTISLPPVINSSYTAVTAKTKNLFIEITGPCKDDIEDALSVIAVILQRAGFTLHAVRISGAKNSTFAPVARKITLDPGLVLDTLGLDLSGPGIISCLKKSRIDASLKNHMIHCVIPRHRFDMFGPMDVIEEIALGYGIAGLEPKMSPSQTLGSADHTAKKLRVIDDMLTGMGYTEVLNTCLMSHDTLYGATGRAPAKTLGVLDSKSGEHTVLRDSVLPGLVGTLAGNIHQPYPQRLYETGTVFYPKNPVGEKTCLAGVLASADADFSKVKSVIKSAFGVGFGIDIDTRTSSDAIFEDGQAADIMAGGAIVGVVGRISSKTLDHFKIRVPVAGFEVSLTGLIFD